LGQQLQLQQQQNETRGFVSAYKLVWIYDPELQLLDPSKANPRVSEILGSHPERRRSSLFGRHGIFFFLCCCL
jgi:hypothetical protein